MLAETDFLNLLENSEMLEITYAARRATAWISSVVSAQQIARSCGSVSCCVRIIGGV